jgi:hypothetical protein
VCSPCKCSAAVACRHIGCALHSLGDFSSAWPCARVSAWNCTGVRIMVGRVKETMTLTHVLSLVSFFLKFKLPMPNTPGPLQVARGSKRAIASKYYVHLSVLSRIADANSCLKKDLVPVSSTFLFRSSVKIYSTSYPNLFPLSSSNLP